MPAFLTHLLAANDSFNRLTSPEKDILSFNYATYLWGSVGPDLFYFHNFLGGRSPLPDYGHTLHDYKPRELLEAMGLYVALRQNSPEYNTLVAYQAGFMSHYHLDSMTHPYIYSQSELFAGLSSDRVRGGSHHRLEADISSAMYRHKTGQSVHTFSPKQRLSFNRDMAMVVAVMLRQLLQDIYGIIMPPEPIVDAFEDTLNAQVVIHDPTGFLFKAGASLVDVFRGREATPFASHICQDNISYDVLNQSHREWFRCDDTRVGSHRSFMELFDQAVEATTDDITEILRLTQSREAFTPPYALLFTEGAPPGSR